MTTRGVRRRLARIAWAAWLACAACAGAASLEEQAARANVSSVTQRYRPGDARVALPQLGAMSPLADYLRFAMLHSPRVEAAYYAWAAAVEAITPARSLPDPRLTLESDVADTVMTLMSGLMIELPGPGKLRAAGAVMEAESRIAYYGFEREVLRTALAVKTAYYRARFLEESLRVQRETLALLTDLEQLAQLQNAAGRATLQDVLRAQIGRAQVETQIANLEDSRTALVAELKAALGLGPDDADPPLPAAFELSAADPRPEEVMALALARNPQLRAMEDDVRRAESALVLARKSGVPDFGFGIEVDTEADPTSFRPSAEVTLPIWRERLRAQIAAAQAGKRAAQARVGAEQVELAAELSAMLYTYREAVRNQELLDQALVPKARRSLEAARAGYVNGRATFLDVIDAQRSLLEFELARIDATTQRELALAALSLTICGVPPAGAPVLEDGPALPEEQP